MEREGRGKMKKGRKMTEGEGREGERRRVCLEFCLPPRGNPCDGV